MALRLLLVGVLAAVLALGLAVLLLQSQPPAVDGEGAYPPEEEAVTSTPSLRGAVATAPPASEEETRAVPRAHPAASTAWRGRVTDPRGRAVAGAKIVLLAKGERTSPRVLEAASPVAVTDADGRWQVEGVSTAGHWLCALAGDLFVPAALDGDGLAETGADLRLSPSAVLRVSTRVVEGALADDDALWVRCRPTERVSPATSPFPRDVSRRVEPLGITSIPLPADASVSVRIESDDWYAEPPSIEVDGLPTAIHFDLHPTCSLDVRVTSAEDGKPLRLNLGLAVGDKATPVGGEGWIMTTAWPQQDGLVAHPLGLRKGTYAVHVKASGYRDLEAEVTFEAAGEHRTVEARLERAPEVGALRLELAHPEEEVGVETAFVIAMRPASGGPWRSKPEAARTGLSPGVTRLDVEALVEGVYDVMVWMRPTMQVGYALSVAVHGGVETTASLPMAAGHRVELDKDRQGPRYVRLEAPPLGRLPLIHFWGTSYTVTDERVEATAPDLGPYPAEAVQLEVSPRPLR